MLSSSDFLELLTVVYVRVMYLPGDMTYLLVDSHRLLLSVNNVPRPPWYGMTH